MHPFDADFQLVQVHRFDQKVDHTVFQGPDGVVQGRISGHDDHRDGVVYRTDVFGQLQSVHFGHIDVGEAAVDFFFGNDVDGNATVFGSQDMVPFAMKYSDATSRILSSSSTNNRVSLGVSVIAILVVYVILRCIIIRVPDITLPCLASPCLSCT
jgi:hypothetical protein